MAGKDNQAASELPTSAALRAWAEARLRHKAALGPDEIEVLLV
jgi:hypothetical protein